MTPVGFEILINEPFAVMYLACSVICTLVFSYKSLSSQVPNALLFSPIIGMLWPLVLVVFFFAAAYHLYEQKFVWCNSKEHDWYEYIRMTTYRDRVDYIKCKKCTKRRYLKGRIEYSSGSMSRELEDSDIGQVVEKIIRKNGMVEI